MSPALYKCFSMSGSKAAGMTPTMRNGVPSSCTLRPTTFGSALKDLRHNPSLMIAT
jgi:hypothetical protein